MTKPQQQNQGKIAFFAGSETDADPAWYMDSGATNHVIAELDNIDINTTYKGKKKLMVGNGKYLNITHIGSTRLGSHRNKPVRLGNVLRVLDIKKNLINVSKLTYENDVSIEFYPDFCLVKDLKTSVALLQRTLDNGLYFFTRPKSTGINHDFLSSSSHKAIFSVNLSSTNVTSCIPVFLLACLDNFNCGIDVCVMLLIKLFNMS